jgi:hypothetical protein
MWLCELQTSRPIEITVGQKVRGLSVCTADLRERLWDTWVPQLMLRRHDSKRAMTHK